MLRGCLFYMLFLVTMRGLAEERRESFDRQPLWDEFQNRSAGQPQRIVQDFGYSPTDHAGGRRGEIGGYVTSAAEPAYYGCEIEESSFDTRLQASGRFAATSRKFHVLVGFFNSHTAKEWRTGNSIALRIMGRGDYFYAYVEYCTSRWRAGGDRPQPFGKFDDPRTSRMQLVEFPISGATYKWSLEYDPRANEGRGAVIAQLGNERAVCHLGPGHKEDGARFDRFGIMPVLKSYDDGGQVWLDDLQINGVVESFDTDPQWDGQNNRHQYESTNIRPRFDFGFSPTHYAGGVGVGEMGGIIFRGDCRYPERLAYYGDSIGPLSLAQPLRADGRLALRRGVSDSTVLLGFFHSRRSFEVNDSQDGSWPINFVGVAIEGPSSQGFLLYPAYRFDEHRQGCATGDDRPPILPDGRPHQFEFAYSLRTGAKPPRLSAALDGRQVGIDLDPGDRPELIRFDRFGIVTTWIDGNAQHVYFDDLTYTVR